MSADAELEKLRLQRELAELQYKREKEEREARERDAERAHRLDIEREDRKAREAMFMANAPAAAPAAVVSNNNNNNNVTVVVNADMGSSGRYDLRTANLCCMVGSLFGVCGLHRGYLDDYGGCCCQVRLRVARVMMH